MRTLVEPELMPRQPTSIDPAEAVVTLGTVGGEPDRPPALLGAPSSGEGATTPGGRGVAGPVVAGAGQTPTVASRFRGPGDPVVAEDLRVAERRGDRHRRTPRWHAAARDARAVEREAGDRRVARCRAGRAGDR